MILITKRQHYLLKKVCNGWQDYMNGKMGVDNYGSDCSCGCKYFIELQDSGDWGVCYNPESPRAGLLTWEHMGCPNFATENMKKIKTKPIKIAFMARAGKVKLREPSILSTKPIKISFMKMAKHRKVE